MAGAVWKLASLRDRLCHIPKLSTSLFNAPGLLPPVGSYILLPVCRRWLSVRQQRLPVLEIRHDGVSRRQTVSLEEVMRHMRHRLPLRDWRLLTKGDMSTFKASILPRPLSDCYILELEKIRLICWADHCLVIETQHKQFTQFIQELGRRICPSPTTPGDQHHASAARPEPKCDVIAEYADGLDFEHRVMESALKIITRKFRRHLELVRPALDLLLQQIAADPNTVMLRRLLAMKKSLSEFESQVSQVSRELSSLLGNNEDMTGLYLTQPARRLEEHQEVELLLEAYLADMEEIEHAIKHMKDMVEDTNQFISAHLDTVRNKMIRMSLFMEMGTLSFGSGAVLAGIFGMNLTSGLEGHPTAFLLTCGGISVVMVGLFAQLARKYKTVNVDTTSAHSYKVLKNFFTYVDDLDMVLQTNSGSSTKLSAKEFKLLLNKITGDKVPDEESEFIFHMFDINRDRQLDTVKELHLGPETQRPEDGSRSEGGQQRL